MSALASTLAFDPKSNGSSKTYSAQGIKIDITPFRSLCDKENIFIHRLFRKYGFELRVAGGAVRDVLLGVEPKDVDFATDATPTQMHEMFSKEEIRTLNVNGESHGTVTARINDKINFEITTLRIDTDTDGRHAAVVFTNDWKLDAARRDLTVNSMFLSVDIDDSLNSGDDMAEQPPLESAVDKLAENTRPTGRVSGTLYDYFNGRQDLFARRIRFVGDPVSRICEDYLRILRYFRFHGRLSRDSEYDLHEEETLKAISENCAGLANISGERCWVELRKILLYPSTPLLLHRMFDAGIFSHIGFPREPDFAEVDQLWERGVLRHNPSPATCLAALLLSMEQLEELNDRLKLSNAELLILMYILKHRKTCMQLAPSDILTHFQHELLLSQEAHNKLRPVLTEMLFYMGCDPDIVEQWSMWNPPKFPVSGHDVQAKWSILPREMRFYLYSLRKLWVESGCTSSSDELLSDATRSILPLGQSPAEPIAREAKRTRRSK